MPLIHFVLADGTTQSIKAAVDTTVMHLAKHHQLPGILANCGGMCCCATCHVHIDPKWSNQLVAMDDEESDMLDFAEGVDAHSRLSCQIKITDDMDGLVVHVPESQH